MRVDTKRYRLKLTIPAGGTVGMILKLFPNATTFVANLTDAQFQNYANAVVILSAFGVGVVVEETK